MKILFSTSTAPTFEVETGAVGGHQVDAACRSLDWGKTGLRKQWHHVREAIAVMRQARRYQVLVLCTVGIEAFLVGRLRWLVCPRTKVVCADFLMPQETRLMTIVGTWLRGIHAFVCIRTGDIPVMERRFGIPESRCHFAFFPANLPPESAITKEQGYIYSAGWAHRDWPTLLRALKDVPYQAILSVSRTLDVPAEVRERVRVLPQCTPTEGRLLMAGASLVALAFEDTFLPSGPLVLLDAMAMGKAVVTTRVNGTRDYVDSPRTGVLTEPGDSEALAAALTRLMEDEALRRSTGQAAREEAGSRFTGRQFMDRILHVCENC